MASPTLFDAPAAPAAPAPAPARERLYLADALALAYRAHFAFISRPLVNSRGMNTSAVYGFAGALIKLLEDEKPEHLAVVFDKLDGKPNFRDALYDQYKANRPPMPDGIRDGLPYIKRLVEAFDIPVVEEEGVEADDVIGTLARRAESEGVDVVIVSPDKDFRQLLSPCVSIFRPAYRGESFDRETEATFRERYGLEPPQFADVLALLGDTSDNVPGVPGIGDKSAAPLIQQFGSVENLLEHTDEIPQKRIREGLANNRDLALLSKRLVLIDTQVPLELDWHRLHVTAPDLPAIQEIFDEMEFGGPLRARVAAYARGDRPGARTAAAPAPVVEAAPAPSTDAGVVEYRTILAHDDLRDVSEVLEGRDAIGFDAKMSTGDPHMASLVAVSIAPEERTAIYVPTPLPDGTPAPQALDAVRPALEDPVIRKVGHHVKADILVLGHHGVDVAGPLFDTMIAHYLIDAESSHRLEDISSGFLHFRPRLLEEVTGTGRAALALRDLAIDQVAPFGCSDADLALRLWPILSARLEQDGLTTIAEEVEFPLVHVLAAMESTGVKVDLEVLDEIRDGLDAEIISLEAEVHRQAGREFMIGSTQQLSAVLFSSDSDGGIGLKPLEKTGKGAHSTNERVLAELSAQHPLPGLVLDWRRLTKLKSTYVDALPAMVHPVTGRVHTDYAQTVAATGRLSSQNPNLQNIPIRSERGREIRRAFVAAPGYVLLSADYAQIELRILAHLSGDAGLVDAFESGMDIHTATAMRVFGAGTPDDVTREMRARVKQVNYGIPYGISAFGLAQRLRIPSKEAQVLIDQWSASYPGVVGFLNTLVERARETGYAETLLGRRRYIPTITARNPAERQAAERIAVNMPMQGSQADMIKRAMVTLHRRFREEGLGVRMLLQVHDELVFEVPESEVDAARELISTVMATALPLNVPIEVDIGVGPNWLDAH